MGVYLSQPIVEKESSDSESGWLKCGVSSMQGWRVTQEDAHNCVLDFDKGASFFAVYDGHGGHEVAEYTAKNLPEFIKKLESYKKGDFEQALIDAFIDFDSTLTQESVIAELKAIASSRNDSNDQSKEEEEGENVQELCEEARMPLTELLAKYTTGNKPPGLRRVAGEASSSSSPASPYLKAKPSSSGEPGSSKSSEASGSSINGLPELNGEAEKEDISDPAEETSEKKEEDGEKSDKVINGEHSKEDNSSGDVKADDSAGSCDEEKKKSPAKSDTKKVKDEGEDYDERLMKSAIRYAKKKATVTMLAQLFEDGSESDSDNDENFQANTSTVENEDEDDEEGEPGDDEEAEEEEEDDEEDSDDEEDDAVEPREEDETVGNDSGCTAVAALLVGKDLFVANAGDSRAVLCSAGGTAVDLSIDHKPDDASELARITAAGGRVTPDGRVNGGLNLSRAIGDHFYKKCEGKGAREQMITALPDIKTWTVKPGEDEFLVLACDGIWNSFSSQEVVDFIRPLLLSGEKLSSICEKLFDRCLAPDTLGDGTGCDNMTCIIIQFDKDKCTSVSSESAKRSASPLPDSESNKRTKVDTTVNA